jgi:uncharacterized protein YjbI with pentapeptide repeats
VRPDVAGRHHDSHPSGATIFQNRNPILTGADLRGATLDGANLNDANLSGADLSGTGLVSLRLQGAVLDRAISGHRKSI